MAVIGAVPAPLVTTVAHAAGHVMPESRQAEGQSLLDPAQRAAFASAGSLLALRPIPWMLLAGTTTGLPTAALALAWLRWAARRSHATARLTLGASARGSGGSGGGVARSTPAAHTLGFSQG